MLPMWPDDDATAQRLGHSICWQRSRVERQCLAQEHAALSAAGLRASLERYEWASMVMKTRAHARMDTGHALFPIIDLANHASVGATAKVVVDSGSVNLVAAYTLSPGDEVTICYDVNADYMDLVERYGFFDASSVIWTAEIGVSQDALCCADAASAALVSGLAEEGCCSEHGAWWVPDTKVEACPLLAALRATLAAPEERTADSLEAAIASLRAGPIRAEEAARALFVALVQAHLDGYSTSLEEDMVALEELARCRKSTNDDGLPSAAIAVERERFALRILTFEKQLLRSVMS